MSKRIMTGIVCTVLLGLCLMADLKARESPKIDIKEVPYVSTITITDSKGRVHVIKIENKKVTK